MAKTSRRVRSRPTRTRRSRPSRLRARPAAQSAPPSGALEVVLATRNPGKVRELLDLLRDLPLQVYTLHAFPPVPGRGDLRYRAQRADSQTPGRCASQITHRPIPRGGGSRHTGRRGADV